MQSPAEPELIKRSKDGDHQAFRKLVEAHQSFAYSVAFRFTGIQSEAEDITQEAFIRLWKNLGKFRDGTKLSTWLYKIIVNLSLDFQKSSRRKHDRNTVDVEGGDDIADRDNSEKRKDDFEMLVVIIALAKILPAQQQTVFVLRDLETLPVEEVCEITGMNAGKVKSNLYYARMKIREGLTRHYRELSKNTTG